MRSPNRTHDRSSFFKYMSAATARIVLANYMLRWSSPVLFNDPFDVPRELSFGIEAEQIVEALAQQVTTLIEHPPEDTSHLEPKLRLVVETVKKGVSPELKAELLEGVKEVAASHRPAGATMDHLRDLWRSRLPDLRILCLTESLAHAAMWFHYADQYKGAVLELRCDDEIDSAWLAAQPVAYPKTKPEIYTAEGWAGLLTMRNDLAVKKLHHVSTYTKAHDWSYENEWRVVTYKRPDDTGHFTDYKFHPRELAGIYLGPLISSADREALLTAAEVYPIAKVFQVSLGMSRDFLINETRG